MIKIGNLLNLQSKDMKDYEVWAIVRRPNELPRGIKNVSALAPSEELFTKYRNVFHEGKFNKEWFESTYVPTFLKDLSENQEALMLLDTLVDASKRKNYLLGCYCEDELLCHRSIVAGVLLGKGAVIDSNMDYKKYYDIFLNLISER